MTIDLLLTAAVGIAAGYAWTESALLAWVHDPVVDRVGRSSRTPGWARTGIDCAPCVGFWPATCYAVAHPTWTAWETIGAAALALVAHLIYLEVRAVAGVAIGALRAYAHQATR